MSRDADDFAEFVRARSTALVRSATLMVGDLHAAEDLVQTALERACRRWGSIRKSDSPEAYVRKIIVNLANDRWSRIRRRAEGPIETDHAVQGDAYAAIDLRDQLMRALLTLPIGMRTVLVLRFFDGLPAEAIASMLGLSQGTVRSQAARGLAKLREATHGDLGMTSGRVLDVQFGGAA